MTKRLNEILSEARERRIVEQYLEYLSDLTEEEAEEEISQLDELSRDTLKSYLSKTADHERVYKGTEKGTNRKFGRLAARGRLTDRHLASEEVEPIDELSRHTLNSYIVKATVNKEKNRQGYNAASTKLFKTRRPDQLGRDDYESDDEFELRKKRVVKRAENARNDMNKTHRNIEKRNVGTSRAARRLMAKEETLNLGGYQPEPGAERDFVSKHKVKKTADRNGNGDAVFKGTTKTAKYPRADKGGAVASTEEVVRDRK